MSVIGLDPGVTYPEWMLRGVCAQTDPELFFRTGDTGQAKQVCMSCEVRVECLGYALDNDIESGIWGGTSGKQRDRMKRADRGQVAA